MLSFKEVDDLIIFVYSPKDNPENWMVNEIQEGNDVSYKQTFHFKPEDLYKFPDPETDDDLFDGTPIEFVFAKKVGDYFEITRGILHHNYDIYIHSDITFDIRLFVAERNISILNAIANIAHTDIYLGGNNSNAIPANIYDELLEQFPNSYEKSLYAAARVSAVIGQYIDIPIDHEKKIQKYLNKKASRRGANLKKTFKEIDVYKYQTILQKVQNMLASENEYNEDQWQKEIMQIILLLYPKYIAAFREAPIKFDVKKYLDYMLVDANGHIDIAEIKKPADKSIVTKSMYRDNYVPLRELSGTIMQIEKYIFYLNRFASNVEKDLTIKYKDQLPDGFHIKITNPSAIIIMGRENTLTPEQKMDFEVIKRKYKNVIDIITYDNLIKRLEFTIQQIQKT